MADEPNKTDEPNGGQEPGGGTETPKTFTQEELDRIVAARVAREKEKLTEYEKLKEEHAKLLEEKKQREEAEMTELERAKKEREELEAKMKQLEEEANQFKTKWQQHEEKLKEQIEKELEGLTENQQNIINALPLESRLDAIREFKQTKPKSGEWGKGSPGEGVKSLDEINEMKARGDIRWREEYKKYRQFAH